MRRQLLPWLQVVLDLHAAALAAVRGIRQGLLEGRQPLQRRKVATQGLKTFNPRFEDDFAPGKDFDPDRCAHQDSGSGLKGLGFGALG